jgi:glycosyltransferase involved in cell wall biosynthesis
MINILSIENSLKWSWSFALLQLKKYLNYNVVRTQRSCVISNDLIDFFDVSLFQNVDTLKNIQDNDSSYKNDNQNKIIVRLGGMAIDEKHDKNRHNRQLEKVGAIVGTNNELYDIAKSVNKNSYLIPNGVDLKLFCPVDEMPEDKYLQSSNKQTYKKREVFTVGFAGNIHGEGQDYKGWNLYSQAISYMYYVNHVEVLFNHSQVPHEDMPKEFYHKIDCLILPSKGEGCSNVTMEALACGVPVIITKVGYHGEMLEPGVNCLFIDRSVDSIISAVNTLMKDEQLQKNLSVNGRKFAIEHHDINKIAMQYDSVIKSVLKKNKRADLVNADKNKTARKKAKAKPVRNRFDKKTTRN